MKGAEAVHYPNKVSIRLNDEDTERFQDLCLGLGIAPSTAIRVFVNAFIASEGFPFPVRKTAVAERPRTVTEPDLVCREGHICSMPAADRAPQTTCSMSVPVGTVTYTEMEGCTMEGKE